MSSGFISEAELEERRRFRQEEWEKVRKPDEPMEAPEEQYDHRSLFERLQEQKQKKDMEYQESIKLKNMIKGLDDEEVEFLDLVEQRKAEEEKRKWAEEAKEIRDFREAVSTLQEQSLSERLSAEIRLPATLAAGNSKQNSVSIGAKKNSQHRLLAGAVVKKRPLAEAVASPEKRPRLARSEEVVGNEGACSREGGVSDLVERGSARVEAGLQCIGVLPGLGNYQDSSDSDVSSNTDDELPGTFSGYDLLGRKVGPTVRKAKQEGR
ncbi:PSME3-interacting protein [Ischnura elegans]|uniref:PSME3-interacting protein n=1 Tax=Ischnura elegans TaxID=197161 RepID=UPI001ED8BDAF|nr:PSME3-interacting protein [Ischnura elegans]XP_046385056.1 PSME3-interacting protein [Ischnura elegans]XP_046385057.1 PSME3-interacting protein [Ischnura elegans]XP_046385058.1 PSME3-interacting protein [Ischnura elegans]